MKKDQNSIELLNLEGMSKHAMIYIEGDSDLELNKMNARIVRSLLSEDRKAALKQKPNPWEDIITAIHWRDPLGVEDTYTECNEEMMHRLLKENAPCITAFGLKKSFCDSVVRNEIDKYATKVDAALNVKGNLGLVPVQFDEWAVEEKLISPKKGSPVTARLNHFMGWKANFMIDYFDHVYSLTEIVNFINLAGFGLGIGSGRKSGYGRYHVVKVEG